MYKTAGPHHLHPDPNEVQKQLGNGHDHILWVGRFLLPGFTRSRTEIPLPLTTGHSLELRQIGVSGAYIGAPYDAPIESEKILSLKQC